MSPNCDLWTLSAAARWTFSRLCKPPRRPSSRPSRAGAECVNAHSFLRLARNKLEKWAGISRHYSDERPVRGRQSPPTFPAR